MNESKVVFVGAGPGDPELITVKGQRLLREADVIIYAGSLVNPALLEGLKAEIHNSAGMNLDEIIEVMKRGVSAGLRVVRLHTGDLSFYSAICEQIERLRVLNIAYEAVPGVSAVGAAAATLAQELTIPDVTQSVIHTRMAGRTPVPDAESIESFAVHGATMAVFLSVSMIGELTEKLLLGAYTKDTPVVVVEKASWPEERVVRGTVGDIAQKVSEAGIKKTALILVGEALRSSLESTGHVSKLYDAEFKHEYRS